MQRLVIIVAALLIGGVTSGADFEVTDAAKLKKLERELEVRVVEDLAQKLGLTTVVKRDKDFETFTTDRLLQIISSARTDRVYEPDTRETVPPSLLLPPPADSIAPVLAGKSITDEVRRNLRGVAAVFDADDLKTDGNDQVLKQEQTYKDKKKLCSKTKFETEISAARCTAFLYTTNIVATAGHCVQDSNVKDKRFVFGFDGDGRGRRFATADVYSGEEIVEQKTGTLDYALVRLDRAVDASREPLPVDFTHTVQEADVVYVIGYPAGLPLKFAPDGHVTDVGLSETFIARIDVLGGSSGSPVFLQSSDKVIGILAHGQEGYLSTGQCEVLRECPVGPLAGCDGEGCTRVTELRLRPTPAVAAVVTAGPIALPNANR